MKIACLSLLVPALRAQTLGTTNLLEGPASGGDSVVLAANGGWTASANASWLHLSVANQSGTGSTNVIFTFDANAGATHTGTLTIAGKVLTVTQAGSAYVATSNMFQLVYSGLNMPRCVAADGAGNVYIADTGNNAIKEWVAASNGVITLVSSGLNQPNSVAVDGMGNVYIADTGNNQIKEWVAASNTVITLVASGLSSPRGVAVDSTGNVYIADTAHNAVKEWSPTNNAVTTLVSSGLNLPYGVAVDVAGNVYIADTSNNAIKEWLVNNGTLTTLVSSGLAGPRAVAVDGAGNVYIADSAHSSIKEWSPASNTTITLGFTGLGQPSGVAADALGNIYFSDTIRGTANEVLHAFMDTTAKVEAPGAGVDALPAVVPLTAVLPAPLVPFTGSPWLTVVNFTNGVVNFAFTANTSATNRTATIFGIGKVVAVTQAAVQPPFLTGFMPLGGGAFQFGFSNSQGVPFTIWTTTNISVPFSNWTVLGLPTNLGSGQYQFTDLTATNNASRFYRVSSP
ncbi:MAG TPA: BACON domain-containing carbohydrate-binding protein [Verrucomicrobiae bacterium]|nr:BACON domain-containing carbohydrate-binding protein [Verrucomicrobiae bacterium]